MTLPNNTNNDPVLPGLPKPQNVTNVTKPVNQTNVTKPINQTNTTRPASNGTNATKPLPDNGYRTTFRMEGNLDSFDMAGGEEEFILMLAKSLGIDPKYITINSVTVGSVIIEFDINLPNDYLVTAE
jgi:hypothetical protein